MYLDVNNNAGSGTRQVAGVLLGAHYENILVLVFVIETTSSLYNSALWIYAEELSIPLLDHVCNLLLCVRIISLEVIALA